jgi:hypothetical protein
MFFGRHHQDITIRVVGYFEFQLSMSASLNIASIVLYFIGGFIGIVGTLEGSIKGLMALDAFNRGWNKPVSPPVRCFDRSHSMGECNRAGCQALTLLGS